MLLISEFSISVLIYSYVDENLAYDKMAMGISELYGP